MYYGQPNNRNYGNFLYSNYRKNNSKKPKKTSYSAQIICIICIVLSIGIFVYIKFTQSNTPSASDVMDLVGSIKDGDVGTEEIIGSFSDSSSSNYDLSGLSFSTDNLNISDEYLYNIQTTIDLINNQRTANGFNALIADSKMVGAACKRAEELVTAYDSIRPDGNLNESIMSEFSVNYVNFAELRDSGSTSPSSVVNIWTSSDEAKQNILSAIYTRVGVGLYKDSEGTYYWTVLFAN